MNASAEMVAVELGDVAQLAELCRFVHRWLGVATPAVAESLTDFAGPTARARLLEAVEHLGYTLTRAVPCTSPHRVTHTCPLGPGEVLGLAELLIDLAANGFPVHPDQVDCMVDDCRRWALRLLRTQGAHPVTSPP